MAQEIAIWNVQELNLTGQVRGDDFSVIITLSEEGKDFSGTTARMQARKTIQETEALDIVAEVDTATLGQAILTFREDAANTTSLQGEYLYDVEVSIDAQKRTYVAGKITFQEDITRP